MGPTPTELVARSGGIDLTGTLWRPPGPARAAVVMHPGSGPTDRHNDDLFAQVRPLFLGAGLAVASFDKRGVGGSGGDWRDAGIAEQADDLLAAVAATRTVVPGVSGVPVGVYGHSQGGWVAVEAAGRAGADVAFVVSSSGPAVSPVEQERFALETALDRAVTAGDLAPERSDDVRAAFRTMVDGWRTAGSFAEAEARLQGHADPEATSWVARASWRPTDEGEWRLARLLAAHDPGPALRATSVPLLALYGDDDRVVPVEASVDVLRGAVAPDRLTVAVLPGGDHRLQHGDPPVLVDGLAPALSAFLARAILA